jgi:hypothetical protein
VIGLYLLLFLHYWGYSSAKAKIGQFIIEKQAFNARDTANLNPVLW